MNERVKLELFGVSHSYRYQALRQQLIEKLDRENIWFDLSDINAIDRFIEAGLSSVPAIRIEKTRVFTLTEKDDVGHMVEAICSYIANTMVRSVIVPVDFSPVSRNAARYAARLAPYYGYRIELLHVYHPVVDPHNAIVLDPELGDVHRKNLTMFAHELSAAASREIGHDHLVEPRFEVGYPLPTIVELSREDNVAFITMGTLGATNILDDVFGNVSSSVAAQIQKPLLLIPPEVEFSPPKHIMVAFSKELIDDGALHTLLMMNAPFKAHIDFVHVEDTDGHDFEIIRDGLMARLLKNNSIGFSFDIRQIASRSGGIADDIITSAEEIKPDWVTLVPKHRSFIERLFHTSVTRKLCLHGHRPLMVLHSR